MLSGIDPTFSDYNYEKPVYEIMPEMDKIWSRVEGQRDMNKAIKTMKHPEHFYALKPKLDQIMKDLEPILDSGAYRDMYAPGEEVSKLRLKVDEAFKDIKADLAVVWKDIKPGMERYLYPFKIMHHTFNTLPLLPFLFVTYSMSDYSVVST
jgi:hypothetical protein